MHLGPLHHIGIVVPSFENAIAFYETAWGPNCIGEPIDTEDGVARIRFVQAPNVLIELIKPIADNTDLTVFLEANPSGAQHHICYAVEDIHVAWTWFDSIGAEIVCPIVAGVLGYPIFFAKPPGMEGFLTEIIEIRPIQKDVPAA
jgi:methylmalonyl-CoA/ethylmalonyl-CoA epimerase